MLFSAAKSKLTPVKEAAVASQKGSKMAAADAADDNLSLPPTLNPNTEAWQSGQWRRETRWGEGNRIDYIDTTACFATPPTPPVIVNLVRCYCC